MIDKPGKGAFHATPLMAIYRDTEWIQLCLGALTKTAAHLSLFRQRRRRRKKRPLPPPENSSPSGCELSAGWSECEAANVLSQDVTAGECAARINFRVANAVGCIHQVAVLLWSAEMHCDVIMQRALGN